jgi:hypothetical protein
MPRKMTQEQFICKSKKIHKNKYDYSKVKYINSKIKVIIICPIHGDFEQPPNQHLCGKGCMWCGGRYKIDTREFVKRARKIHCDTYDYSQVAYVNNNTKVKIICPEHGSFHQTPSHHLMGKGS